MELAFDQVVAAFVAKLEESPAVCSLILNSDDRPVSDDVNEAVNVFFYVSQPQPLTINGAPIDWITRVIVDCFARSKTLPARKAPSQLAKKVYERLAIDPTLGNGDWFIGYPSIETDADVQSQRAGMMRLTYRVEHRTSANILE